MTSISRAPVSRPPSLGPFPSMQPPPPSPFPFIAESPRLPRPFPSLQSLRGSNTCWPRRANREAAPAGQDACTRCARTRCGLYSSTCSRRYHASCTRLACGCCGLCSSTCCRRFCGTYILEETVNIQMELTADDETVEAHPIDGHVE